MVLQTKAKEVVKVDPEIAIRLVKKWLDIFELGGWTLSLAVHNEESEADGALNTEAYCDAQPEISHAAVVIHGWHIRDMDHLDRVCCHESLHVLFAFTEVAMRHSVKPKKLARMLIEWPIERLAVALTKPQITPPLTVPIQVIKEPKR